MISTIPIFGGSKETEKGSGNTGASLSWVSNSRAMLPDPSLSPHGCFTMEYEFYGNTEIKWPPFPYPGHI